MIKIARCCRPDAQHRNWKNTTETASCIIPCPA